MEATFSTRGRFKPLSHACALYPQFKASHLKHFYIYYVGPRSTRFPLLTWKLSNLHWWVCLRSEEPGNSSFMSKITRKMTQVLTRGWTLQKWPVKNLSRGYPSLLLPPFSIFFSSKNISRWYAWIIKMYHWKHDALRITNVWSFDFSDNIIIRSFPLVAISFFRKYGLDDNTIDFIGHAVALYKEDSYLSEPAIETVKRMKVSISDNNEIH